GSVIDRGAINRSRYRPPTPRPPCVCAHHRPHQSIIVTVYHHYPLRTTITGMPAVEASGGAQQPDNLTVHLHGPRDFRLSQHPVPVPKPDELLVRIHSVGICGT